MAALIANIGLRSDRENPLKLLTHVQFEGQPSLVQAAALAMMQEVFSCVWSGVRMEVLRCRAHKVTRDVRDERAGTNHEHTAVYHRPVLHVETNDPQIG